MAEQARGDRRQLVLGATVRTLGAWPSGWRYPNAHRNPKDDRLELTRIALAAEAAGLQFLYFGDWLATSADFEFTDPYLLARVEPFAAISYLAAITSKIGLLATVSSSHAEPYSTARSSASIDLLSDGRVGLSVTSGSEAQSASNFGWRVIHPEADRIAAASEFIDILRGLWDSWDDEAFLADADSGRLIDASGLHALGYEGKLRSSAGPLNVLRSPQGHPPIALVGAAENSRQLAARSADVCFVSPRTIADGVELYANAKRDAAAWGRNPDHYLLMCSIFPIIGETREAAWQLYDELVELVPVELVAGRAEIEGLPPNRTIRSLSDVLGVSLNGVRIDDYLTERLALRFSDQARALIRIVGARSGRRVGGQRGITFRHLLVAHVVTAPILVGSAEDVADHFESWFTRRAVDGFTVLSAFGDQFETFARLVVPELRRRGLFPDEYLGETLRDHLGLDAATSTLSAGKAPQYTDANGMRIRRP
ncbi:MAG TPA: NtaA/DmoA family FMN-dependent monooxygenase [Galbitalea sp.]|nr:NtaA/DmoA family FMN-dependent monooxygenase [Galbitalea sp.]